MKFLMDVEEYKEPEKTPTPSPFSTFFKVVTPVFITLFVVYCVLFEMPADLPTAPFNRQQSNSNAIDFIYDTDMKYSEYIQGNLSEKQLLKLDELLELEKQQSGLPLENITVLKMSSYDQAVIDAYARWREIYNFRRSGSKSVYPSERQLYTRI